MPKMDSSSAEASRRSRITLERHGTCCGRQVMRKASSCGPAAPNPQSRHTREPFMSACVRRRGHKDKTVGVIETQPLPCLCNITEARSTGGDSICRLFLAAARRPRTPVFASAGRSHLPHLALCHITPTRSRYQGALADARSDHRWSGLGSGRRFQSDIGKYSLP